ncbi:hypothetical protein J4471_01160 [Candidatus Woesearchaeota archaeon]|nr:hypothetical protein [Candidatus Woesearchaeota archaeon]
MVDKKYKLLFSYAFFKAEGEDGVHEWLDEDVTTSQALANIKSWYPNADEYRISDLPLPAPYAFLFAPKRSPDDILKYFESGICDYSRDDISDIIRHLDDINKKL